MLSLSLAWETFAQRQPNVVLVITDDQGYGDLHAHGNAVIQTPAMDKLYQESARLTNFHVSPTCAPTRAALMTGRYNNRTGVWHTVMGRSLLRADETTMADIFRQAGYTTGIFGKWHLGDNYPFRPQDRGFQEVLVHGGGGVQQIPDYWNNDYFDDTYQHNGQYEKFSGYCTDVWFQAAMQFVETHQDKPFFCYLPTNAPHSPFHVAESYINMYKDKENVPNANFYGMITQLDENLARLDKKLRELNLTDNTIFIFMTDNGTSAGVNIDQEGFAVQGYNAGMRGKKGSPYEGGHRVPCLIRWPNGGVAAGKDFSELTAHIDLLPTLIDLCGIKPDDAIAFDGISLKTLLQNRQQNNGNRIIITDSQRKEQPEKWRQSAVMSQRWRLVNRTALYDIQADSGQRQDVARQHPEVVATLQQAYERWWADIAARFGEYNHTLVGTEKENPVRLTCHDWHGIELPGQAALLEKGAEVNPPWHQRQVREAVAANGFWAIEIARAGTYEISLQRWPTEAEVALTAALPPTEPVPGGNSLPEGESLPITQARLQVGDTEKVKEVTGNEPSVTFQLYLSKGKTQLKTWFASKESPTRGAYYVIIRHLAP